MIELLLGVVPYALPLLAPLVTWAGGKALAPVVARQPVKQANSRTNAGATFVTALGILSQVIVELDQIPELKMLLGSYGGVALTVAGVLMRAYRDVSPK